jgi:hypothetical protein
MKREPYKLTICIVRKIENAINFSKENPIILMMEKMRVKETEGDIYGKVRH